MWQDHILTFLIAGSTGATEQRSWQLRMQTWHVSFVLSATRVQTSGFMMNRWCFHT